MKPYVILALARSGTRALVRAIGSHPDLDPLHEFRRDEGQFWEHPQVHSNLLRDWMLTDEIAKIHVYRSDAVAGAISGCMMMYEFPDGVAHLDPSWVLRLAKRRRQFDAEMQRAADWSVSYESLCEGGQLKNMPEWFSRELCERLDVPHAPLSTGVIERRRRPILQNEDEILALTN